MNRAILIYSGSSRAANDPWAFYGGDFSESGEVSTSRLRPQSTACTDVGLLWVQAIATFGNEPQLVSGVMGVEARASPVSNSTEAEARQRVEMAIRLLDEWMADESGYDEETWPELKAALDRDRLSSRRLFDE